MRVKPFVVSLVVTLPLLPLCALAQSTPPSPQCERSCVLDYEEHVEQCAKAQDRQACYQQADLAYRTCLAICH